MIVWIIEVWCDADFDGSWELIAIVDSRETALATLQAKHDAIRANADDRSFGTPSLSEGEKEVRLYWCNREWRATPDEVKTQPVEIP